MSEAMVDAPDRLFAAHERLREGGVPIVSLVSGQSSFDARVWLGRWAKSRDRDVVLAPSGDPAAARFAYDRLTPAGIATDRAPVLAMLGIFRDNLNAGFALSLSRPRLPVVVLCGIDEAIHCLLDPKIPKDLVSKMLQGLVPIGTVQRNLIEIVANSRQTPFLRGACEGLLYYMLEARGATRGQFKTNVRLPNGRGGRAHEVDLCCEDARLVVEIDGLEHRHRKRAEMDARKQDDLEAQGFRVRRFANQTVIEKPVEVWKDIAAQLEKSSHLKAQAK